MAKEWILNNVMNRFQFNYKRNVGAVSEEIRKRAPRNLQEWRDYYFAEVRKKAEIEDLGRRLYGRISEDVAAELKEITEKDCIEYMLEMVIERTYEGYDTEIKTINGRLEKALGVEISPAPDDWDRGYNVDFFIEVKGRFIGIQVKPVNSAPHVYQLHKERALQEQTHAAFREKFGGGVFYVYSIKRGGDKEVENVEVIEEIRKEISRLAASAD